jgi:hypothetical protein
VLGNRRIRMTAMAERTQKLLYTVSVFEHDTVMTIHGDSNEVQRFVVSPDQLQNFFNVETKFQPEEGLVWMKKKGNTETYLHRFPKSGKPTEVMVKRGERVKKYKLKLPNLLVITKVCGDGHDRRITGINMWCYADGKLTGNTMLYEVPLPNISGNSMCLGNVSVKVQGSVRDAVWSAIFDSYFNNHHNVVGRKPVAFDKYMAQTKGIVKMRGLRRLCRANKVLEGRLH